MPRDAAPPTRFSLARAYAIALKEFVQMRRDRLTFAMIVGIPIAQVLLFGYAINTDPKHLPTAIVDYDRTDLTRSIASALANTRYFAPAPARPDALGADALLAPQLSARCRGSASARSRTRNSSRCAATG